MSTTRRRLISVGTSALFVLAALVLLLMTAGPRLLHYRTATMLTGSMAPGIKPGDVVVDTPESAAQIRVGQIITYHIPVQDHRVESHRVVWVGHGSDGAVLIRTRGDANNTDDPWTARIDSAQVWRVRMVLPGMGSVIRMLRQPVTHLLLTAVVPVLLVVWLLFAIWGRDAAQDDDTGPEGPGRHRAGSVREQDGDRGAAAGRVAEVDAAAVRGGDAGAGGQAEPGAGDVGAQPGERRDDALALVGGNA